MEESLNCSGPSFIVNVKPFIRVIIKDYKRLKYELCHLLNVVICPVQMLSVPRLKALVNCALIIIALIAIQFKHPYPTEDEKRAIAAQTNLTILQVNNW